MSGVIAGGLLGYAAALFIRQSASPKTDGVSATLREIAGQGANLPILGFIWGVAFAIWKQSNELLILGPVFGIAIGMVVRAVLAGSPPASNAESSAIPDTQVPASDAEFTQAETTPPRQREVSEMTKQLATVAKEARELIDMLEERTRLLESHVLELERQAGFASATVTRSADATTSVSRNLGMAATEVEPSASASTAAPLESLMASPTGAPRFEPDQPAAEPSADARVLDLLSSGGVPPAELPGPAAIYIPTDDGLKLVLVNTKESVAEDTSTNSSMSRAENEVPAPAPTAPPSAPTEDPVTYFLKRVAGWMLGGNAIVRVGVIILFAGLGFLLKYAAEKDLIPIELRHAAVACGAIGMLVFGWRIRNRPDRQEYALTMQGAAVGILYLTIFSAFRLYNIVPVVIAFPMLVAVAATSTLLAVKQSSLVFACVGIVGGFMAPIFATTGSGNHVFLFAYYAVLNAGIFATAWFKSWRVLNLLGFVFTFVISLIWGAQYYRPEYLSSTQPFLILFFLAYLGIALRYAFREAPKLTHYVDGTLIFGTPIAAFGLQAGLMRGVEYGLAISAFVLSALYIALAFWLSRRHFTKLRLLMESFLALGVIFGVLVVPLALDARWTSAAWALEGAAVFWVGVRQGRSLARFFGLALQPLAGVAFLIGWQPAGDAPLFLNHHFIGVLLLAGSAFYLAGLIRTNRERVTAFEQSSVVPLLIWGLLWWIVGGLGEVLRNLAPGYASWVGILAFASLTAIACEGYANRLRFRITAALSLCHLAILIAVALAALSLRHRFALDFGWLVWPFALATQAWLLFLNDRSLQSPTTADPSVGAEPTASSAPISYAPAHVVSFLLAVVIGAVELRATVAAVELGGSGWSLSAVVLVPLVALWWVAQERSAEFWPVRDHPQAYRLTSGSIIVGALVAWSLAGNVTHTASAAPLPYLPLLNPLDVTHSLFALVTVMWWRKTARLMPSDLPTYPLLVAGALIMFIWVNAVLLRTLHHYFGIPYQPAVLWESVVVQAALSIFWTVLALACMVAGARKKVRGIWMMGAVLMAVVVVKLLIVDLGALSGVERIVSFMGVGALMLVIGYFAPVPPARANAPTGEQKSGDGATSARADVGEADSVPATPAEAKS